MQTIDCLIDGGGSLDSMRSNIIHGTRTGTGGFHSQHVLERAKIPGIKLPLLDYNKMQRNIKTGRGNLIGEESLSGFYSLERTLNSRDKIDVQNPMAAKSIVSPRAMN